MKTYGLIGYPLGHSFSRKFFTEKFLRENTDAQYLNFEIQEPALFPGILEENPGLAGLNVTIPYKERIIPWLDHLDQVAEETGAVNTIRISRINGELYLEGYNTDVAGFSGSITPLLQSWHTSALILGTGGASKAVKYALENMGIRTLRVSRTPRGSNTVAYRDIDGCLLEEYKIIVNTTPVGTFPDAGHFPDLPYQYITPEHLLFDLVYNPSETQFLALGGKMGAVTKNGYEMLIIQALKSYEIWNS